MTIDKAIEILNDLLGEGPQFSPSKMMLLSCSNSEADDRREAVQLGLDSLVRYKQQHEYPYHVISKPLPGETDDKREMARTHRRQNMNVINALRVQNKLK